MFDLGFERVADWIKGRGHSSVALQMPEGLKPRAMDFAGRLNEMGVSAIILGDPCYGACDLDRDYKEWADALIHFGHSPIPSMGDDPDILFVEVSFDGDVGPMVAAVADSLPSRVGLLATVQYVGCIPAAARAIEDSGRVAVVGMGDARIAHPGQVLGCNVSSAESVSGEVDGYLFLGEGDFHPLAASFACDKPVLVLNPISGETRSLDEKRDRMLRVRFAAIERAKDATSFLVLVCSKAGQTREADARDAVDAIRAAGKRANVAVMAEINPDALLPYDVDAYVCTGCPRIAMDDAALYGKPMLTPQEARIALGLEHWDDYAFDAIRPDQS
ncbi:MAG: diphthamide biosynthesis enzyme Dph2 [Thermoplasmatales archaeon]|nr:diphthamide biosynthesis enzyme Dph2 [Thermoplasmatales archaeon]